MDMTNPSIRNAHNAICHPCDTDRRKLELWDKLVKAANAVMDELNATSDVPPNSIYAPKCFQKLIDILAKAAEIDGNKELK